MNRRRAVLFALGPVVILGLCVLLSLLKQEYDRRRKESTPAMITSDQIAKAGQLTPEPEPTGTSENGEDKIDKPTPSPTPVPLDVSLYTADLVRFEEPLEGITRLDYYMRDEPGRTATRVVRLPIGTSVWITCSCTNMFHEPWYGIRTTVDGTDYEGFVQQSTTVLGSEVPEPVASSQLIPVEEIEEPEGTLGPDKDGDGVYVVVLDPGHGGKFSGACHYGTNEKDLNLKTAWYVKTYLESNYSNVTVFMTRTGDFVYDTFDSDDDLEYRIRYAVDRNADLVLSLHYNAFDGRQNGAMALVARKPNVFEKERLFASYLLQEMKYLGLESAGIRRKESAITKYLDGTGMDGYLILRLSAEADITACIIEHCFMDSRIDRKFWDTEEKIKLLAEADGKAIARFLDLTAVTAGE